MRLIYQLGQQESGLPHFMDRPRTRDISGVELSKGTETNSNDPGPIYRLPLETFNEKVLESGKAQELKGENLDSCSPLVHPWRFRCRNRT